SRKEGITSFEPGRWKDRHIPAGVDRADLIGSAADRRSGSDDLWTDVAAVAASCTEFFDDSFVRADHRTKRPGNEVQLVLNYQRWRRTEPAAIGCDAEEGADRRVPGELRKFIHGADHKIGWRSVKIFIDHDERQVASGELAARVVAAVRNRRRSV